MSSSLRTAALAAAVLIAAAAASWTPAPRRGGPPAPDQAAAAERLARLPIRFEPNVGQSDPGVRFIGRAPGYMAFLRDRDVLLRLPGPAHDLVRFAFVDGGGAALDGEAPQRTLTNYYIGSDPRAWHVDVPSFGRARYRGMYAGIDVVFYGSGSELEYDLVVAPHADPSVIRVAIDGAARVALDPGGDLVVETAHGHLRKKKPIAYQEVDGTRVAVDAAYTLAAGEREITFALGAYDRAHTLVIDPIVTGPDGLLIGGSGNDSLSDVAVRPNGNVVAVGSTSSADVHAGAGSPNSSSHGMIAEFDATLQSVERVTLVGGSGSDTIAGIELDAAGQAFVCGNTFSTDFPTTAGAADTTSNGGGDGFVVRLASDHALTAGTLVGGGGADVIRAIAIDAGASPVIAGDTTSAGLATGGALQSNRTGSMSGVVIKLHASLSSVSAATYFSAETGVTSIQAIEFDATGRIVVAGYTDGAGLPTTPDAFQGVAGGGFDGFLARMNPALTTLEHSTLIGGNRDDFLFDVERLDARVCVTGSTDSTAGFAPPSIGAVLPPFDTDAFFGCLDPAGSLQLTRVRERGFEAAGDLLILDPATIAILGEKAGHFDRFSAFESAASGLDRLFSNGALGPVSFGSNFEALDFAQLDFNGDSLLDLAVVGAARSEARLLKLLLRSAGGLQVVSTQALPDGVAIVDTVPAGGGRHDLFFAGASGAYFMAHDGNTTFQPPVTVAGTGGIAFGELLTVGDRVVALRQAAPQAFVLGRTPSGASVSQTLDLQAEASRAAAADFNNDGQLDLATLDPANVRVFVFNGSQFQLQQTLSESGVTDIAAIDLRGDGCADLAFAIGQSLRIRENPCGSFAPAVSIGSSGAVVGAGDFSGDGKPDLVGSGFSGGVFKFLNQTTSNGPLTLTSTFVGFTGRAPPNRIEPTPAEILIAGGYPSDASTRIIDIADPLRPVVLRSVVSGGPGNDRAFAAAAGGGSLFVAGSVSAGVAGFNGGSTDGFLNRLAYLPLNLPPSIEALSNTAMLLNQTADLPVLVGDPDLPRVDGKLGVCALCHLNGTNGAIWTLAATSTNEALLPNGSIDLFHSSDDASRWTARFTPTANVSGVTTVSITARDQNGASATRALTVTVAAAAGTSPPPPPPTNEPLPPGPPPGTPPPTGTTPTNPEPPAPPPQPQPPQPLASILAELKTSLDPRDEAMYEAVVTFFFFHTLTAATGSAADDPAGVIVEVGRAPGAADVGIYQTGLSSTFVIGGLRPGTYYVRARTFNEAGSSPPSNEVRLVAPDPTGAPHNLRAVVRDRTVAIAWDRPANSSSVTGYLVEVGSASGLSDIASEETSSTGLTVARVPDGTYYVRVKTLTTRGRHLASNEVTVVVGVPVGPCGRTLHAPRALTGQAIGSLVELSWLPAADGGLPDAYVVVAGSGPGLSDRGTIAIDAAFTRASGMLDNGTYAFRVVPMNECGPGAASNEIMLTVGGPPPLAPTAPQALTATVEGTRVTLDWAPPFGGDMPTRYVIDVLAPSGALLVSFDTGNAATTFVYDHAPPGAYVVRVRGANAAGSGPASEGLAVTVASP